jgi:hypothetical protein
MTDAEQNMELCNVCYRCREFITLNDTPKMKQRVILFSRLHRSHPHGFNPNINLSHYRCVDQQIDALIKI